MRVVSDRFGIRQAQLVALRTMRNSQHREHRNRGIVNAETAGW
jgi:hypothetical protein